MRTLRQRDACNRMKMPGKRAKPVVETQMISLADIAFLIIFFFMLTSQFMRESAAIRLRGRKSSTGRRVQFDAAAVARHARVIT
jgi:biopolymer transport protein ExbD